MKNGTIKEGTVLVAEYGCDFPDRTTKGKEYKVTKVDDYEGLGQRFFRIVNDEGKDVLPISTRFRIKS